MLFVRFLGTRSMASGQGKCRDRTQPAAFTMGATGLNTEPALSNT